MGRNWILENFTFPERVRALIAFYKQYQGGAYWEVFKKEFKESLKKGLIEWA